MRRFFAWLGRRIDLKLLETRVSEGLREAALLWFVFSLLDMLIKRQLTIPWLFWNSLVSLVVWLAGTYLEIRKRS